MCTVAAKILFPVSLGGDSASWHEKYKDSAYIFVGGLDYVLTEGDIIQVFSQYVACSGRI